MEINLINLPLTQTHVDRSNVPPAVSTRLADRGAFVRNVGHPVAFSFSSSRGRVISLAFARLSSAETPERDTVGRARIAIYVLHLRVYRNCNLSCEKRGIVNPFTLVSPLTQVKRVPYTHARTHTYVRTRTHRTR